MGRAFMSEQEKWHADAIARAASHRANLELFTGLKDKASARMHREALVRALMDLGEFDEAGQHAAPKGRALPGCRIIRREIQEVRRAVERDDSEICGCAREVATIPHPNPHHHVQAHLVQLRRRYSLGWVFSKKHNKVVTIWRCRHCGDLNAHDLIPEGHISQIQHRALLEAEARRRKVPGANFPIDPAFGDQEILRASTQRR